jgi:hypothetical protein
MAAEAGTARGASQQTCSSCWPARYSARSSRHAVEPFERTGSSCRVSARKRRPLRELPFRRRVSIRGRLRLVVPRGHGCARLPSMRRPLPHQENHDSRMAERPIRLYCLSATTRSPMQA